MSTEMDADVLLRSEASRAPASSLTDRIQPTKHGLKMKKRQNGPDGEGINAKLYVLEKYFSHRVPGQHYYEGIMCNNLMPRERLIQLQSIQVKHDDVIVTGYPKSGTTWLEEIVYLIEHDGNLEKSNSQPVYIRVPYLEGAYAGALMESMESPRIYKTHLPHRMLPRQVGEKRPKIVHILRNPQDIAVSYYHFYRALSDLGHYAGGWDEFLSMFMAGYVCCGDWFEHVKDWWPHRHDANVLVLRYEHMKRDLGSAVLRIADFLGKRLTDDQLRRIVQHTSFDSMKKNPMLNFEGVPTIDSSISPFMRKGQTGDWKNYFSSLQAEAFGELMSKKLGAVIDLHFDLE